MTSISGSPMYNYTLALELQRLGHSVSMYSMWAPNKLRDDLVKRKIMTYYSTPTGHFDLVFISQPDFKHVLEDITAKKIINIVHSEYDCETPIISPKIDHYVAIRQAIKDHLIQDHGIPGDMISVIYNGIDFKRFSPSRRKENKENYIKVVIPCTLDALRTKFIDHYIRKANERFRVFLYGKDYGISFYKNEFVTIKPEMFFIEQAMADADLVAGILLGRVNLEARAMGIVSLIHNPDKPEEYSYFFPRWEDFQRENNITNVANKLLNL